MVKNLLPLTNPQQICCEFAPALSRAFLVDGELHSFAPQLNSVRGMSLVLMMTNTKTCYALLQSQQPLHAPMLFITLLCV